VLALDEHTPQIDAASILKSMPPVISHTVGLSLAQQEHEAKMRRAREESERTGRPMKYDERGRPVLPRFPLLTGILPFLFSASCLLRLFVLTLTLLVWGGLLLDGVSHWANWNNHNGDGQVAFAGLAETLMGGAIFIVWFAAFASIAIAIIADSAVGADRIEDWPSLNFIHSIAEILPTAIAITFSAAPGYLLAQLIAQEPWQTAALAGGSLILGLPLIMLSQQAGSSTWEIIDLDVLGAMFRSPFSMLLTYVYSVFLLSLCGAAAYFAWLVNPYLMLATAPLIVACLFVYARILGRLGWRLSEKIVVDKPDDEEPPSASKNYNPPRSSKRPS
jgi:hypothetical protein